MSRTLTSYHRYPPKQAEVAKLAKSSSTLMLPNLVRTLGLRDYLSFAFRWALCRVLCNDESMKSDSHPPCCAPQCGLPRDLLAASKVRRSSVPIPPQHRLYFFPDPQGHSSFRPTLGALCRVSGMRVVPAKASRCFLKYRHVGDYFFPLLWADPDQDASPVLRRAHGKASWGSLIRRSPRRCRIPVPINRPVISVAIRQQDKEQKHIYQLISGERPILCQAGPDL